MNPFIDIRYNHDVEEYVTKPVFQYDQGLKLRIFGTENQTTQVHYSVGAMVNAPVDIAVKVDDAWTSNIPNSMLAGSSDIKAYVYLANETTAQTIIKIRIPVRARERPADFILEEDKLNDITNAINSMNEMTTLGNQTIASAAEATENANESAANADNATQNAQQAAQYANQAGDKALQNASLGARSQPFEIAASAWQGTGPYTYTITRNDVTAKTLCIPNISTEVFRLLSEDIKWYTEAGKITLQTVKIPSDTISGTLALFETMEVSNV